MTVLFSPWGNQQFFDENGDPATGWKIYSYAAGSSTALATYTTSAGSVAQSNPVVLDALGFATGGQIWLTSGLSYKLVLTDANGVVKKTEDNITGVTGVATTSQWQASGLTPTYVSATSFTLSGDQTSAFHINRRLQFTTTAGTVYGTILSSAYAALTTVTVIMDSGQILDSGLSQVNYGLLTATNDSIPGTVARVGDEKVQCFRLTLTTALPVTTADVTGATTIYATPISGKCIDLYDGTRWNRRTSAEFSLALGTLTSGKPYDVFCYDNAGVPTLEFLVWTNDTTRATALAYQDGVLVKSGAATRRYLGSFYTTAATTTEDSLAKRYLWNYYHRVKRAMTVTDANATWPYQTATWRQGDNSTANQLNFIIGVAEDSVFSTLTVSAVSSSTNNGYSGIGLDSTTPTSKRAITGFTTATGTNTVAYEVLPAAGRHFLAWCEYGAGGGTLLWNGTNGEIVSGMFGSVMA